MFTGEDFENFTTKDITNSLKSVINGISGFALWMALAVFAILIIAGIIVNFKFHDKFKSFLKIAVSILVGFAVALISVLLFLQITRLSLKEEINTNFWLWFGFTVTTVVLVVSCTFIKIFKPKFFGLSAIISTALILAFAIVILCLYPLAGEDYKPQGSQALYIALSAILVVVIAVTSILMDKTKNTTTNTKSLTYAGICIAIAYALSYIKFFDGPQGSSVTLVSMLPIMLYSYMFGAKKGVIAGLVYGVLQCLQDPQIYEPLQVMLDYPIAFSALGLAGIFKDKKFLKGNKILEFAFGIAVAGLCRYCAHVLSGYFIFYSWSAFENTFVYSLVYNSAVLIDAALDVFVGAMLFTSKSLLNYISMVNPDTLNNTDSVEDNE